MHARLVVKVDLGMGYALEMEAIGALFGGKGAKLGTLSVEGN